MKEDKITSQTIHSLYSKEANDEDVFELIDKPGIHVIKKYKDKTAPAERNYRMFISLFLRENNIVSGGVDTVKAKKDDDLSGYPVVFDDQKDWKNLFGKKYINFLFGYDEDIVFDTSSKKIKYKNHDFTINEFVNLLVKNHIGGLFNDMFWKGRISNFFKNYFILEPAFWLIDDDYKKNRISFLLKENRTGAEEKKTTADMVPDPIFKYFYVFKNTLILSILWLLIPIFWLSIILDTDYFSISNPLWFFVAILIFSILERVSKILFLNIRQNKDSFIHKIAKDTLNMRGELRIY